MNTPQNANQRKGRHARLFAWIFVGLALLILPTSLFPVLAKHHHYGRIKREGAVVICRVVEAPSHALETEGGNLWFEPPRGDAVKGRVETEGGAGVLSLYVTEELLSAYPPDSEIEIKSIAGEPGMYVVEEVIDGTYLSASILLLLDVLLLVFCGVMARRLFKLSDRARNSAAEQV